MVSHAMRMVSQSMLMASHSLLMTSWTARPVMFWIHGGANVQGSNLEGAVFHGGMYVQQWLRLWQEA